MVVELHKVRRRKGDGLSRTWNIAGVLRRRGSIRLSLAIWAIVVGVIIGVRMRSLATVVHGSQEEEEGEMASWAASSSEGLGNDCPFDERDHMMSTLR